MAKKARVTRYKIDVRDVQRWLDRLSEQPDEHAIGEFEGILTRLYAETQAVVHIVTGSLKASGKVDATHRKTTWRGEIRYGGPSGGAVHDPVTYAIYEAARGGAHDFMAPLEHADRLFADAVKDTLRRAD